MAKPTPHVAAAAAEDGIGRLPHHIGAARAQGDAHIALKGRWTLKLPAPNAASLHPAKWDGVERIHLEGAELGGWDSSLILFLLQLADFADRRGIEMNAEGLPPSARRLLDLARRTPRRADPRRATPAAARESAELKLRMVGLQGLDDNYPFEISGGMRRRAALARSIALDPEIL
jgi:ABC-type dipeptide/oligopeptide/nickel transport system ATPase component